MTSEPSPELVANWDRLIDAAFQYAQREGTSEGAYQSLLRSIQLQMNYPFETAKELADHWRAGYDKRFLGADVNLGVPNDPRWSMVTPSTEEVLAAVLSSTLPPLPPQEQHLAGTTVLWWETDPGEVYIHAEGGTPDNRHYVTSLAAIQLEGHGYRRAQFDLDASTAPEPPDYRKATGPEHCGGCKMFDRGICWGFGNKQVKADHVCNEFAPEVEAEHTASLRTASWPELMAKAKRLIQSGQVHVLRNGFNYIVGHVVGDHGEYDTEISRDDPSTRAITGWQCSCPWDQYAWQRTRKWKKFEGRPCAHVMALYWKALSTPLDEQLSPEQAEALGTGQSLPAPAVPEHAPGREPGTPHPEHEHLPRSFGPEGDIIQGDQQQLGIPPDALGGPPGPAQAPLAPPPGQGPHGPQPPGVLPPFPGEQMAMPWAGPGTTPGGGVSPPGAMSVPGAKPPSPFNPIQGPGTYSKLAMPGVPWVLIDAGHKAWTDVGTTAVPDEGRADPSHPEFDPTSPAPLSMEERIMQTMQRLVPGYSAVQYERAMQIAADMLMFAEREAHANLQDFEKPLRRMLGMAQRSGDPQLDGLIVEFVRQGTWFDKDDAERPIDVLRTPEGATGLCGDVSCDFADFCQNHDVDAEVTDGEQPESYGYADRSVPGMPLHHAVHVRMPSGIYLVDFSASQYGYSEFPMVQKMDDGQWQRDWSDAGTYSKVAAGFNAPQPVRAKKPIMGLAEGPVKGQHGDGTYMEVPAGTPGEVRGVDNVGGQQWIECIFPLEESGENEPFHIKAFVEPGDIEAAGNMTPSDPFIRRHTKVANRQVLYHGTTHDVGPEGLVPYEAPGAISDDLSNGPAVYLTEDPDEARGYGPIVYAVDVTGLSLDPVDSRNGYDYLAREPIPSDRIQRLEPGTSREPDDRPYDPHA